MIIAPPEVIEDMLDEDSHDYECPTCGSHETLVSVDHKLECASCDTTSEIPDDDLWIEAYGDREASEEEQEPLGETNEVKEE